MAVTAADLLGLASAAGFDHDACADGAAIARRATFELELDPIVAIANAVVE